MIKEKRSWSKDESVPNLIARKRVDWSIFVYGSHIPIEFHEDFKQVNGGVVLNKGEAEDIVLFINEIEYKAILINVNRKDVGDSLQIRYEKNVQLKELLREKLEISYKYLIDERFKRKKNNKSAGIIVPDNLAEYIEFYETGVPFQYKLKIIASVQPKTEEVKVITEPERNEDAIINEERQSINFSDLKPLELLNHIHNYIASCGFKYSLADLANYYLSLRSKPFVILAGISGTGKSKLVELFAGAVGATSVNGQYAMIPVRPDWNDGSDLLGYKDINGKFIPGHLTRVIKRANEESDKPFFVCLDEMNLSRVEYYFSDLLSLMETKKKTGKEYLSDRIFYPDYFINKNDREEFGSLCLTPNIYIIGTVNMDETTFPFSKKVLDRANTIEFSTVNLKSIPEDDTEDIQPVKAGSSSFISEYLCLKDCLSYRDFIILLVDKLENINSILARANLHIGYRVRDEICFYMVYNKRFGLLDEDDALDYQLVQKILPRIQGSDNLVFQILLRLFRIATGQDYTKEDGNTGEMALKYVKNNPVIKPYPRTAAKIATMLWRFEDGFTSFWL